MQNNAELNLKTKIHMNSKKEHASEQPQKITSSIPADNTQKKHLKLNFPHEKNDPLLSQQKESASSRASPMVETRKQLDLRSGDVGLSERIEQLVLNQQQNPSVACFHPADQEPDNHPCPRKFIQCREELLKKHPTEDKEKDHNGTQDREKEKRKFLSVNEFEMLKLLGVGSAGHVYLVRKKDNNHLYAMKVLTSLLQCILQCYLCLLIQ